MKLPGLLLFCLTLQAQTWTSYRNTATTTNPPYFSSWNRPVYDPVSHTSLIYVNDQGNSIYSNSLWSWNSATNIMTKIGTSGSTGPNGSSCPGDTPTWPGDRHPLGQMVIDSRRNKMWLFGGPNQVCPVGNDLYTLTLTATPTGDTWTHKANPAHYPGGNTGLGCAYDPDDDVIFCYGRNGGSTSLNNSVYCPTDLNPTPGTLTAKQTAAGCANADDFSTVTISGTQPTDDFTPAVVYDTANKKIILLGAYTGGPTPASLELSLYDVPTKTWTPQSPSSAPGSPVTNDSGNIIGVPMDFNQNDGKIYYFRTDPTANGLYTWSVGASSWTAVCTSCTPTTGGLELGFNTIGLAVDVAQNTLVMWTNANTSVPANFDDGEVIKGQLTSLFAPITITEKGSNTTTNYPIQLGRVFAQGAIADYPQAVISGTAVTTQADVQSRWQDGSVKHAVLSFLIPTLSSGTTITVAFQDQMSCNCGSGSRLSQSDMLAVGYNFNAQIVLTNGVSATADARTMLNAGSWTYWLQGSINTCALIADDSLTRAYDVGGDSHKSLRPRFEACFWPTINKVRVRITLEDSDTIALQDQAYDVVLKTGNTSPSTVLTQTGITHSGMSRWSREFWIGGTPTAIEINHNFAYLISTKQIFNYDQTKTPTSAALLTSWASSPHTLFYTDSGFFTKYMPTTGGRQELAPLPEWVVVYAYTQDYQLWDVATRMLELSMTWPIHYREGTNTRSSGTRYFNQPNTLAALGLPISTGGHPTLTLSSPTSSSDSTDNITAVGTLTDQGWTPDQSHGFDAWNLVYLLSGEYTFYEESLFWNSYNSLEDSANSSVNYGRGPTGAEAVLPVPQTRAWAWELRSRVNLAWAAPDGLIGTELIQDVADAFASFEGGHNITTGTYNGNAVWTWQNGNANGLYRDTTSVPSPLGIFSTGDPATRDGLDTSIVSAGISPWMENYIIIAVGRAVELGFAGTATLNFLGPRVINEITNAGYNNHYLAAAYEQAALNNSSNWFASTWANQKTAYLDANFTDWTGTMLSPGDAGNCADCYRYVAMATTSFTTGLSNGLSAWNVMSGILLGNSVINSDPQFAIVPRSSGPGNSGNFGISGKVTVSGNMAIR